VSDWDGMEDAWLDSYWEERLSGPNPEYDQDWLEYERRDIDRDDDETEE